MATFELMYLSAVSGSFIGATTTVPASEQTLARRNGAWTLQATGINGQRVVRRNSGFLILGGRYEAFKDARTGVGTFSAANDGIPGLSGNSGVTTAPETT